MDLWYTAAPLGTSPDRDLPGTADAHLVGSRLTLARVAWVVMAVLTLGLILAGIPLHFAQLQAVCTDAVCKDWQLSSEGLRELHDLGLSLDRYAAYMVALQAGSAIVWAGVAAVIFWRRSDERMALFTSFFLLTFGAATSNALLHAPGLNYPVLRTVTPLVYILGVASFGLFLYLFPDGRFVPRRTRWMALGWIAWQVTQYFFPASGANLGGLHPLLFLAAVLTLFGGAIYAQVFRYRRVSGPTQRQQTKWVVFGVAAALAGFFTVLAITFLVSPDQSQPGPLGLMVGNTAIYGSMLLIPFSIGVAVLRHGLWDIDVIINRTLVYGALAASVAGVYVLVVTGLGTLLQARGNLLLSLAATGLVAVIFAPLHHRLQRKVNRLMYGERDEPYTVLSRLGQRLEATLPTEAVLPTIVENIAQALKVPQVAIWLLDGETLRLEAYHGEMYSGTAVKDAGAVEALRQAPDGLRPVDLEPSGEYRSVLTASHTALVLPLNYRGELVGALCLVPRGPGEAFSPADRQLLRDLATQSGVAAHSVRLTIALRSSLEDLEQSRERLIVAQEEERRRIQRDLHDGLGPALASMRLRLEACLDVAQGMPGPLVGNLERVYELIGEATRDIRRLVHDLRPSILDQLGLIAALRQHCARFSRETGIEVRFEAEPGLTFPAAAEVAIFRVVQEALVNVEKHARASGVDVRLGRCGEWLTLEIHDNGAGFVDDGQTHRSGTGIRSMRERAEALRGTLRLASHPGAGTELTVRIPDSRR